MTVTIELPKEESEWVQSRSDQFRLGREPVLKIRRVGSFSKGWTDGRIEKAAERDETERDL